MKSRLNVFKIGGKIIEDPAALESLLQSFSNKQGPKILVHGGGALATDLSKKLAIKTQMVEGRRITSKENLEVVTMVYAGLVNKRITALLQKYGCNAIGLAGSDGNAVTSKKRKTEPLDYGYVGDIVKVNASFLKLLLDNGLTPVLSAIGHDGKGQLLNTNADTVAAEIAIAMSNEYEVALQYCFEKKGVLRNVEVDESVITDLNEPFYQQLKAEGIILEGMVPKLDNCFYALKNGVASVKVGSSGLLESEDVLHTNVKLT